MKITIWVDGACPGNGQGARAMGLGALCTHEGGGREFSRLVTEDGATNNRAELLAVELGLEKVRPEYRGEAEVTVASDSQWAIKALSGEWTVTANLDLIARINVLMGEFGRVEFRWVKGHSGSRCNERAHFLACRAVGGER